MGDKPLSTQDAPGSVQGAAGETQEKVSASDVSIAELHPEAAAVDWSGSINSANTKVCVIMNPISGGGKAEHLIMKTSEETKSGTGNHTIPTKCFLDAMKQHNPDIEVKVVNTERAGHAIELAEQYARDGWLVVGSGGDGTLCEILQGVKRYQSADGLRNVPCGFVSAGSMNFFAVSAGIESPVKVSAACCLPHCPLWTSASNCLIQPLSC